MNWKLYVHPFVFAVYMILHIYSENLNLVPPAAILNPVGFLLLCTALGFLVLGLIFRDLSKSAILWSFLLVYLFSYEPLAVAMAKWSIGGERIIRGRYLFPAFTLMFLGLAYSIVRSRIDLRPIHRVLHLVSWTVLLFACIEIAVGLNVAGSALDVAETTEGIKSSLGADLVSEHRPRLGAETGRPDIYYIVLDRYGSNRTLETYFRFDNGPFTKYLEERGFYVAKRSRANYLKTTQSLSSSLNGTFINDLASSVGRENGNWRYYHSLLTDFGILRVLKAKGYKILQFGSWWTPTRWNKHADININQEGLSQFSIAVHFHTVLFTLEKAFGFSLHAYVMRRQQYRRVQYKLRELQKVPAIREPTFAFVHLLVPHNPYVFDQNGNFISQSVARRRSREENFRNQLEYLNGALRLLVDTLLESSPEPPVIILQGDEGPFPQSYFEQGLKFNWENATSQELRQKVEILNAYYFPGIEPSVLYPTITPVNSFRVLLNSYFGHDLPLLSDRTYAHVEDHRPYDFFDVTNRISQDRQDP